MNSGMNRTIPTTTIFLPLARPLYPVVVDARGNENEIEMCKIFIKLKSPGAGTAERCRRSDLAPKCDGRLIPFHLISTLFALLHQAVCILVNNSRPFHDNDRVQKLGPSPQTCYA